MIDGPSELAQAEDRPGFVDNSGKGASPPYGLGPQVFAPPRDDLIVAFLDQADRSCNSVTCMNQMLEVS